MSACKLRPCEWCLPDGNPHCHGRRFQAVDAPKFAAGMEARKRGHMRSQFAKQP